MASSPNLDPLLAPQSIALIGASLKQGSYGHALLSMLKNGGYEGDVYPINPKYLGHDPDQPFYAGMADLPQAPDHTVIAVGTGPLEQAVADAIEGGTKALTVFADTRDHDQKTRITAMVKSAGLPMIGPNSMGVHNLDLKMRVTPFPAPVDLTPGGMALIVQSGSVLGALVNNDRRLRFNTVISTGSESITSAADYLDWVVAQPSTTVVGMFLEAIRAPEQFLEGLEKAAAKNIPVVILKVGRSAVSARMALSHTGAVVGNHDVFKAAVERHGAHLVETVDEMAATMQAFSQGRPAHMASLGGMLSDHNNGIASIHDSGGERELIADLAEDQGVPYAKLSPQTLATIAAVLEPDMEADNPLDAWGTGHGAEDIFTQSFQAMMDDDNVAAGLYMLDWRQHYALHEMHERVIRRVLAQTHKPVFAASHFSLTDNRDMAARMADINLPLLEGSREVMVAMRHLLNHQVFQQHRQHKPRLSPLIAPIADDLSLHWRQAIAQGGLTEDQTMAMFKAYGIPTPNHGVAFSCDEALALADAIGFPVVMKTLADGIHHKTEANGVYINLKTKDAVRAAYDDLSARLSPKVLVAEMINSGVEMALGAVRDPDFGMAVMVSAGGIGVEMFDDRVVLMPPFSAADVEAALAGLKINTMLQGYRGKPAMDIQAFAQLAAGFSDLVIGLDGAVEAIDINPIIVHEQGAVAVDGLVLPRENQRG